MGRTNYIRNISSGAQASFLLNDMRSLNSGYSISTSVFRGLLTSILLFISINCSAGIFDSVLVFKRLEPDFGLEGFNTSLRNHDVTISGIKLGVQWQEKYTAGLAWYSLDSKLDEPKPWLGKSVNARLHMSYTCIYTEYSFFENEYWEWAAGLQTGIGTIYNAYTDNTGSASYNKALSIRRAKTVRDYFISKGIPASRITAFKGYGETKFVDTNSTAIGRSKNRRVVIKATH